MQGQEQCIYIFLPSSGTTLIFITEISIFIQGEEVDYRGALHRDGSVLMSVSLDQLKVTF